MKEQQLNITAFKSILRVHNKKGKLITINARSSACFIITLEGKICFRFNGFSIVTHSKKGIFIPAGTAYQNESLEESESIVVNFETAQKDLSPCSLQSLDSASALRFYHNMNRYSPEEGAESQYYLLSELYLLAYRLFGPKAQKNHKDAIAEKALAFLHDEAEKPMLQIEDVAMHCNISSAYLRRILKEKYHKTPFELLTDVRMRKAMVMLLEACQVKEVALSVGYSDIYQFSRAFKRYYGFSPSEKTEW